ncbi:MAG: 3,8-cyclase [Chloroflexota bacterium]|nr:3,8-cyclase [Chloroflexota bacterium]
MFDQFRRPLRDLRVSVTDRCNFRCTYCMPKGVYGRDFRFLPRPELLSFEEITRLVRVFVESGVRKVRLTGGEPLLRRDLPTLVGQIAAIEGVEDLALTTNGVLLARHARALRDAGLGRVTVSLDSVDDAVFRTMNDRDVPVARVVEGIDAAVEAGLAPPKLNAVIRRGVNDAGVLDLARFARERGCVLRFIEFMDVGTTNGWRLEEVVPAAELVARVDAEMPLEAAAPSYRGEVAGRYRYRDGGGELGIISSVTEPFCTDCTRARLSADGRLYTCLFATEGHDLRGPLRAGASDAQLGDLVAGAWGRRRDRYSEARSELTAGVRRIEMSYIGG